MDATNAKNASGTLVVKRSSPDGKRQGLTSDLFALLVLAFTGFLVGFSANALRSQPLPWKYQSREQIMAANLARFQGVPTPDEVSIPTHEIRLDEFQPFVTEHQGPVLDARPAVFYREGHIPGALSLPRETFTEDYLRLRGQLEGSKDRQIAVYCSGPDCPDSELVAEALTKLGYRRLVIYTSGWEEWSQTGLPQEIAATAP